MSNMSPQYGSFNGGIWQQLEGLGRTWAKAYGTVHVTSGAIFDSDCDEGRDSDEEVSWVSGGRVAVPTHFYKVFVRKKPDASGWAAISFLLEHEDKGSDGKVRERLENALVQLETIERHAEATFHPDLNREQIDETADWNGWRYVLGKRDDEAGCIGNGANKTEAPSHGVETVDNGDDALALYDDTLPSLLSEKRQQQGAFAPRALPRLNAVGSEEAPRRAGLRPPLKRPVRFSRKPLSQRCLIEGSRKEPTKSVVQARIRQ